MKIHPTPQTLATLAWLSWGVVGVEAFLINLLEFKPFIALLATAMSVSVVSAIHYNAGRGEKATREHAELMAKQILTIERFFEMGVRSDTLAKIDAAERCTVNGHDTGPFKMHNRAI